MNSFQQIGATLTGIAAIATASVTVYNTFNKNEKKQLSHQRIGLIYDKDGWTNLRQLPTTSSRVITKLANNLEIVILNESGNWYQVQTRNNLTGFIYKENFLEK
jgi:uncharacterized protein YgiM (DUF1202 family)